MRYAIVLLLALCCGACGEFGSNQQYPIWDLHKPIFVSVENKQVAGGGTSFPDPALFTAAMERSIVQAGGIVTKDSTVDQVITLFDTDGNKCSGASVFAYTDIQPVTRRVAICHTIAVFNNVYDHDINFVTAIMFHELGHMLGNNGFHIGGDSIPNNVCPTAYVMMWNARCHINVNSYVGDDRAYVCNSGATIGGVCDQPLR